MEPKIADLMLCDYRYWPGDCKHEAVKTLTTDKGMVYACERCSSHWFFRYEDINRIRSALSASTEQK